MCVFRFVFSFTFHLLLAALLAFSAQTSCLEQTILNKLFACLLKLSDFASNKFLKTTDFKNGVELLPICLKVILILKFFSGKIFTLRAFFQLRAQFCNTKEHSETAVAVFLFLKTIQNDTRPDHSKFF